MKKIDRILGGMCLGISAIIGWQFCKDNFVTRPREEIARKVDNGITYQYIDTDGNGLYDLYVYQKKRKK